MMQAEKTTSRQRKGEKKRTKRGGEGGRKMEDEGQTGRRNRPYVAGPGERKDGQRKRGCSLAPAPLRRPRHPRVQGEGLPGAPCRRRSHTTPRKPAVCLDLGPQALSSAPSPGEAPRGAQWGDRRARPLSADLTLSLTCLPR